MNGTYNNFVSCPKMHLTFFKFILLKQISNKNNAVPTFIDIPQGNN